MNTDPTESRLNQDEEVAAEAYVAPKTGYAPILSSANPNIPSPENLANLEEESQLHSRREVLVLAIKEFLTGNFEKGKEHWQYIGLQKELSRRGIIPENYYPGSIDKLQTTERTFYAYKKLLRQYPYPVYAYFNPDKDHITIEDSLDSDERVALDQAIPDQDTFIFMRAEAAVQETKRQEEIEKNEHRLLAEAAEKLRRIEREKAELSRRQAQEMVNYNNFLKNDFPEQKTNIEYWDKLITYSEAVQEREEEVFHQVEAVIKKSESSELVPDDISVLNQWLNAHKEFGLKEMSNEEYFSFFKDGRIYAHDTSFFGDQVDYGETHYWTPRFVEALKDGYLLGHDIGQERGDVTYKNRWPERNISFDGPNLLARGLYQPKGNVSYGPEMMHFGYALTKDGAQMSPPVVLVAPDRLIETHSMNLREQQQFASLFHSNSTYLFLDRNNQDFGEGEHFGSTMRDPNDHSHEINLDLFVAVLPEMMVSPKFIRNMLENILSDQRTTEAVKNEISNLQLDDTKGVDFKSFMVELQRVMTENGFAMPRLFFYKPVESFANSSDPSWVVRTGVQTFLEECQIAQQGISSVSTQSSLPISQFNPENIPEQYKIPRWKLEEMANRVRAILRAKSTESQGEPSIAVESEVITKERSSVTQEILAHLSSDEFFKEQLTQDAGVHEGYTLGQHTLMVMTQFDKYFGDKELPLGLDKTFFKYLLAVHDIGKHEAILAGDKKLQHEYTAVHAREILQREGFSAQQIEIGLAVINGDALGNAVKGGALSRSTAEFNRQASEAGLDLNSAQAKAYFFDLLTIFYRVDAGAYTKDATIPGVIVGQPSLDSLFVFDHEKRSLEFSSLSQARVDALKTALI